MTENAEPDPAWWGDVLVSLSEAAELLDEERSTLSSRRNLKADNPRLPRFPEPVETSSRAVLFRLSDVVAYSRVIGKPIAPPLSDHLSALARRFDRGIDRRTVALAVAERAGLASEVTQLPPRLGDLIDQAVEQDGPGKVIERLLSDDDRTGNRSSTFTPADAVDLLAGVASELMSEQTGWTVLDPCAGEGSLLTAIGALDAASEAIGIEIDPPSAQLAQVRLRLAGVSGGVQVADALDLDFDERAELVVADLPFDRDSDTFAWINLALDHLAAGGWGVMQAPDTVLASSSTARRIRAAESGRLRLVARLPAELRRSPKSRIPTLVVLGPAQDSSTGTLVVDLSRTQLDQDEGETKQEHSPVAALVAAARTGRWDESSGSAAPAAVLTPDQLLRTEDVWSLVSGPTPGHYRVVREGIEDSLRRIVLSTEERAGLSPEAAAEADQKTLESLQRLHRRLGRFLSDNGSK